MKLPTLFQIEFPPTQYDEGWAIRFVKDVQSGFEQILQALNGRVNFGDGTDAENIRGKWITFTSNSTPGAETTIAHSLGLTPTAVLFAWPPPSGTVNKGSTAWDATNLYLTFSAASQAMQIFVLIPSGA